MREWFRLRHLAETVTSNVDKLKSESEIPVRLINYTDVYYGDRLTPDLPLMWATASGSEIAKHRVGDGDVLITKDSETADDIGVAAYVESASDDMVCGYHLSRIRADTSRVYPRYLFWTLTGSHARDQMTVAATGVTRFGLRADSIRDLAVRVPSLWEQRAIADYLDIETSRIDALISKKRRMIELLTQRWRADVMSTVYGDDSVRWGAIRHVVDLLPGYAFPSSSFVDEGVRLLRGANISPGRLRWDTNVVYLSPEDRPQLSEYELAEGDLVLGMDRPVIGSGMRVATVTASDLPCLLVQRVARIRVTKRADAQYIRFLIESDAFVAYFSPITTGVSVPHISADQILSFRAPLPSYDVQRALATRLHRERTRLTAMSNRLTAQIALLAERHQALITAAVTGELAVQERVE